MTAHLNRWKLLYKIARAYYEDGLTQFEIAERFGISRIKVSRLLQQARDERIVQITIMPPPGSNADMERALEAKYGLLEAVVVTPSSYEHAIVTRDLGPAGAECLVRALDGNEIVGISWGTTLHAVVEALPVEYWPEMTVVQICGGLGHPQYEIQGTDLARRMAQAFGARLRLVPAPGVVRTKLVHDALLEDPQVNSALALAANADVAILGIGVPATGSVVAMAGILSEDETREFMAQGAVGDIALRFFGGDGRYMQHEVNDRIVGLTIEQIAGIPRRIGVAGGDNKFNVILGALRGQYINVLVTDDRTAAQLIEVNEALVSQPVAIQPSFSHTRE